MILHGLARGRLSLTRAWREAVGVIPSPLHVEREPDGARLTDNPDLKNEMCSIRGNVQTSASVLPAVKSGEAIVKDMRVECGVRAASSEY